jgi:hypothetical protein
MDESSLRGILLETWADPPEIAAQRIFRTDATLPMLCGDLAMADAERCALIALDVIRRRRKRGRAYAVCMRGSLVLVCREDDVAPGEFCALADRDTPAEMLAFRIKQKRDADAMPLPEFQGWTE